MAFALYVSALAFVLLVPSGEVPSCAAGGLADIAEAVGFPEAIVSPGRFEFILNVVIIVPATALAAVLWPGRGWTAWTAYAFFVSLAVEGLQGLFLAERSATFVDVVANTLGASFGAIAGAWVAGRLAARRPTDPTLG